MKFFLINITFLFVLNVFSQSAPITINGEFNDWNSELVTSTDVVETLTGIDLLETQITNDNNYLYIRIKTNNELSLTSDLIDHDLRLFIDTDNDENTGFSIQPGFGSELGILFKERFAYLNINGGSQTINFENFGLRPSPTITSNEFEIAIDRNAIPNGVDNLFGNNTIRLFWQNDANGDRLPNTGNFVYYTFDETPVSQYIPVEINKEQSEFIRVCSYNTLFNGLGDADRLPHFEKIVKAINPDIITFQENSTSYIEIKNFMDTWLPLGTENGWYVYYGIASKWEITNTWTNFTNESPPNYRQTAALVDLPESYNTNLLFVSAHLSFGPYNAERQQQVNGWNNFLNDAKTIGGNIDLPENTPIVYLGDLNLVGYSQQLTSLITGIDENGNGNAPDWDNSDLENTIALQADIPMYYSWKDDNEGNGFPPGKLDYILYTGSVMSEQKSFVLQTETMSNDRLALYNLDANDTSIASDHFPIIADFNIETSLNTKNKQFNNINIYPNPASKVLNINIKNLDYSKLEIIDVYGKCVLKNKIDKTNITINIDKIKAGIYFVKISSNSNNQIIKKLIIK